MRIRLLNGEKYVCLFVIVRFHHQYLVYIQVIEFGIYFYIICYQNPVEEAEEEEEEVEEVREPSRSEKGFNESTVDLAEDTPESLFRRLREVLEARGKKVDLGNRQGLLISVLW